MARYSQIWPDKARYGQIEMDRQPDSQPARRLVSQTARQPDRQTERQK